jgi:hypothetical protein
MKTFFPGSLVVLVCFTTGLSQSRNQATLQTEGAALSLLCKRVPALRASSIQAI